VTEFDIHTGGIDHIPVHHNNEIAQSVCAGNPYARVWMHNAHLNMGEEKMAKSGDNFITLQTFKDRGIDPIALRYVFLGARYSSPLQFSWEALEGADNSIRRLRNILTTLHKFKHSDEINDSETEKYKEKFNTYINDNLDTPKALALMWEVFTNDELSFLNRKQIILHFDTIFGLDLNKETDTPEKVELLIKERDLARNAKDFTKSDELRAKIEEFGFEVKDTPDGTVVNPK
jgi:cysteinyl-tRNA synthetase